MLQARVILTADKVRSYFVRFGTVIESGAMAWTFQALIDARHGVTAFCNDVACVHSQELDLPALAARFGADAPAMASDLKPKLRCAKCGSRDVSLIYSPSRGGNWTGPRPKAYIRL